MAFIKHQGKTYWAPQQAVDAHEAKLAEEKAKTAAKVVKDKAKKITKNNHNI